MSKDRLTHLVMIREVLKEYADGSHGVTLYDLGEDQIVVPNIDPGGSYLTSSVCFMMVRGKGAIEDGAPLPNPREPFKDYGNGWRIMCVEINTNDTPEKLREALEKAKAVLLKEG